MLIGILFLNLVQGVAKSNEKSDGIITGKTTQQVQISISVLVPLPTLEILFPKNVEYLTNNSLRLLFLRNYTKNVWFNIENGANTTVLSSNYNYSSSTFVYFNTTSGNHTLFLYANNNDGNVSSSNVSFIVNSTKLRILYEDFKNAGNSTDFYNYGLEELQNISNVTFEIPFYGKVIFNVPLNITNHSSINSRIIDFDSGVEISLNKISIDTAIFPNLKKPAKLYLRNLAFKNPRILKDGAVCPETICIKESYTNSELIFNVTEFSTYSAEETSETISISTPSSGGGGGGGGETKKTEEKDKGDFDVDAENIIVKLKTSETKSKSIVITNNGTRKEKMYVNIDFYNAKLSESEFELNVNESRNIVIDFFARENTTPDLYVHKLQVSNEFGLSKIIPVAIEIISKRSLFDVKIQIPEKFKVVNPGDEVLAGVSIYNLGEIKRADADVSYIVKDSDGNITFIESESVAVETQTSLIKTIKIPENAKPGYYFVYVMVKYENEVASAAAVLKVVEKERFKKEIIIIWVIIIALALAGIVRLKDYMHIEQIYKKIMPAQKSGEVEKSGITRKQESARIKDEKSRLIKQMRKIESMYQDKFIDEQEYKRVKNEIQRKIKELGDK